MRAERTRRLWTVAAVTGALIGMALPGSAVPGSAVPGSAVPGSALAAPTPGEKQLKEPPVAQDVDPARGRVEVYLEAQVAQAQLEPGKLTEVWAFNGSVPGPTIYANVGDTVVAHFTNNLPEDVSSIHWHGVETPATMDGSNTSQELVPGDGGYFRYEFTALSTGTYWYHPHVSVNEQVDRGLYGALVVRDPKQEKKLRLPADEKVIFLDDVALDETGQIAPEPDDPVERAAMLLNGQEGNTFLVNGQAERVMNVRIGEPQRWRVINSANARSMWISIPGHTMSQIGGDGGLLEQPVARPPITKMPGHAMRDAYPDQGLLLSVAERADIVFTPMGKPGDIIPVEWRDFPRGRHTTFWNDDGSIGFSHAHDDGMRDPEPLMYLRLVGPAEGASEYVPPEKLRDIEAIDATGAEPLSVTFGHGAPDAETGDVTFFAQSTMVDGAMKPLPFSAVTPADAQDVTVGETRVWEVTNLTGSDHPFHAHGWFFQPIEIVYVDEDNPENNLTVPYPYLENKDTIRIPQRPGASGRSRTIVRMAVYFGDEGREGQVAASGKDPTETASGGWVFHCHINEHGDMGMMSFIEQFDRP